MTEVNVTRDITVKNPDQRVEKGSYTHVLIAAETKNLLENPFVQNAVGALPTKQTDFKLIVTQDGATITLGTSVEDLTAIAPTADLAPFKKEYVETCIKIIELLDAEPAPPSSEVKAPPAKTSLDSLDLATTKPSPSETNFQQKVHELEQIQFEQESIINETGDVLDHLQAERERLAGLADDNQRLSSENEELQQQVQDLNELKGRMAQELRSLESAKGDLQAQKANSDQLTESQKQAAKEERDELTGQIKELVGKLAASNGENENLRRLVAESQDSEKSGMREEIPAAEKQTVFRFGEASKEPDFDEILTDLQVTYELQLGERDQTISRLQEEIAQLRAAENSHPQHTEESVENDDEVEIAYLQEQIELLRTQNAEAVQAHDKIQKALLTKLRLQEDLNRDLQGNLDNARDNLREVQAERAIKHPSFASVQVQAKLKRAEEELETLRHQIRTAPENTSPRRASVDRETQVKLKLAQEEIVALREEIDRQAARYEARLRQQNDKSKRLEENLARSEAGRLYYKSVVRST